MWPGLEVVFILAGCKEGFCALETKMAKCFLFPSRSPLSSLALLLSPCSTEV